MPTSPLERRPYRPLTDFPQLPIEIRRQWREVKTGIDQGNHYPELVDPLNETLRQGESITMHTDGRVYEALPDKPKELWTDAWYAKLGQTYLRLGKLRDAGDTVNYHGEDPAVLLNGAISPYTRHILHDKSAVGDILHLHALSPTLRWRVSDELMLVPNTLDYQRRKNTLRIGVMRLDYTEKGAEQLEYHLQLEEERLPRALAESFAFGWEHLLEVERRDRKSNDENNSPELAMPIATDFSPLTRFLMQYASPGRALVIIERLPSDVRQFVLSELEQLPNDEVYRYKKYALTSALTTLSTELADYYQTGLPLAPEFLRELGKAPEQTRILNQWIRRPG